MVGVGEYKGKVKIDEASKISIIVPVYQAEKYLDNCLTSILNQTYRNLQVIVIDDGSTDSSPAICDMYALKDKRVQVVHKNNEGVSATRNLGISIAEGKYISFVDADDWLDERFIQNMLDVAVSESADIVFCDYYEYLKELLRRQYLNYRDIHIFYKNTSKKSSVSYLQKSILYPRLAPMYNSDYTIGVPWGKLYKREFILENDLKFEQNLPLNEDVIFNIYALDASSKTIYKPEPLYYYRISDDSSMKRIDNNVQKALSVRIQLINKYDEMECLSDIKSAIVGKQGILIIQCMQMIKRGAVDSQTKSEVYDLAKKIMIKCHTLPRLRMKLLCKYLFRRWGHT